MPIRIIAGSRRGTHLATLPGSRTRPLLGRVRQSLFDILGATVEEARVLDLFAGSGAVGLEALSRGAAWATFVDDHPGAHEVIAKNIAKLRFQDRTRLVRGRLPAVIDLIPLAPGTQATNGASGGGEGSSESGRSGESGSGGGTGGFDLVSIMPPYGMALLPPTLEALARRADLVAPGGLIVGQFETGEPVPDPAPTPLLAIDERIYGQTHLVFWRRELS